MSNLNGERKGPSFWDLPHNTGVYSGITAELPIGQPVQHKPAVYECPDFDALVGAPEAAKPQVAAAGQVAGAAAVLRTIEISGPRL